MDAYVLTSRKPLPDICKDLTNCGGYAAAKIIYHQTDKSKVETNQTVVICSEKTITAMRQITDYKDRIVSYNWDKFHVPEETAGETWDLHITGIPNTYTVAEAEKFITSRIGRIVPRNTETTKYYSVHFGTVSRETGKIRGYGTLRFSDLVSEDYIQLCKLALHNVRINGEKGESSYVKCIWHVTDVKRSKNKTRTAFNRERKTITVTNVVAASTQDTMGTTGTTGTTETTETTQVLASGTLPSVTTSSTTITATSELPTIS